MTPHPFGSKSPLKDFTDPGGGGSPQTLKTQVNFRNRADFEPAKANRTVHIQTILGKKDSTQNEQPYKLHVRSTLNTLQICFT